MQAKRKPLSEQAPAAAENASAIVAITPPSPRPDGRILGQGADAVPELVRILRDDVGIL